VSVAAAAMVAVGLAWGLVNALCVTRLKMTPFIVTLAMLFIGRGLGLWITQTRPINLPDAFRRLATSEWLGLPAPVWMMAAVAFASHLALMRTPFGRQVCAIGADAAAARKAGVPVLRNIALVYIVCGGCAALAGLITLAQLSAVSPTLGEGRELDAIAAAVLGGVSLFGGRGGAVGAALGAILIQTIFYGLTTLDADPALNLDIDPYYYRLITSAIIFSAVLIDSVRQTLLAARRRRTIRVLTT
jgi:ribose transport system permease protein